MKRLLTLALLSFSLAAGAQTPWTFASTALTIGKWITAESKKVYYIQVRSEGYTPDEARRNGFSYAIDQAVGSIVVSEKEINSDLVRNDIINYSSGYVENFKILSTTAQGNKYVVVQDVWVSHSKIAERALVLGESNGNVMDKEKLNSDWEREKAKMMTADQRSRQASQLFNSIFNDYHRMAYTVKVEKMKVGNATYRRPYYGETTSRSLIITVALKSNDKYFDAIKEAIKTTKEEGYHNQKWSVRVGGLWSGERGGWRDKSIQESFINTFTTNNTQVMLTFVGATGGPRRACFNVDDSHFYSMGYDRLPNGWDERVYNIPSSMDYSYNLIMGLVDSKMSEEQWMNWVQSIRSVDVKIVNESSCR